MSQRFFVEFPVVVGGAVQVVGAEAHHMSHVMRLAVGDEITLFDGTGAEYAGRLTRIEKRGVHVQVLEQRDVDREASIDVELAVALPRGDRQTWLVEKAVELGVRSVIPLMSERSVAVPKDKTLARLQRTVIESSKQCGRNRLMRIEAPRHLTDHLSCAVDFDVIRWLAHPGERTAATVADLTAARTDAKFKIAIGPEGGFTQDEIELARKTGWKLISCGPRVMRVETAAIAISAKVLL